MDVPGVPAGRHILRGALLGAAAGCVLAVFTGSGRSIDLGILVGVSYIVLSAWLSGDLPSPTRDRLEHRMKNSWRTLEPIQQGLLVGLVVGAVIAALTRNLVWIAAFMGLGAGVGWLIGQARARSQRSRSADQATQSHFRSGRRGDDDEDHEPVADSPSSVGRTTVAPAPQSAPAVDREHEVVARGREENVLNGAFTLTLYNRRHTGPIHHGQEPIDVHAALGDLHDTAVIDDAILRTEELLAHAAELGFGAQDARDDRAELQISHPGFTLEHIFEALNWGYRQGR